MPDDDDKKYYRNPGYTNEGLRDEMESRKRGGQAERKPTGEFDLDPVKSEPAQLELEQRLAESQQDPTKKRTFLDPRNFANLMQERLAKHQTAEVQKLTNPQIESLRTAAVKSNSDAVRAKQGLHAFMRSIASAIGALFAKPTSQKKFTMCENYGHIAPATWSGGFPSCVECGKKIRDKSELRKSSATQKDVDVKPFDNRLDM